MFHRLAVHMIRVDALQDLQDFGKSLKPRKLGRQWRCLLITSCQGVIRYYELFRVIPIPPRI